MESSRYIVPVRKIGRRPCACCGKYKATGVIRYGRWRAVPATTQSTVCRECSDKLGFAIRLERWFQRVEPRPDLASVTQDDAA